MRIKFFSNNPRTSHAYINCAFFMMKHWYSLHGAHKDAVEWLSADIVFYNETSDDQLQKVLVDKPDIIGFSIYVWNVDIQFWLIDQIKKLLPDTRIVIGGPYLTAHRDPLFFKNHPNVDYVVYGEGEKAFQQIIDFEIDGKPQEFINIVENHNGLTKVHPYELLQDEKYLNSSWILSQQDFIREHVEAIVNKGIPREDICVIIEFARGCMYNCSFCDWSQNLTKKVNRRKTDWRAELRFIKSLDILVREADANFGQWDEDLEIFKYAASLYDPKKNFSFENTNTSKLGKNAYEIHYLNSAVFKNELRISFQTLNRETLKNINRPALTFEETREKYLDKLRDDPDVEFKKRAAAELMLGLPGDTVDSKLRDLRELVSYGFNNILLHPWELLDNSPAGSDENYSKKYGLQWAKTYTRLLKYEPFRGRIDEIYKMIDENTEQRSRHFSESNYVIATNTMSFLEIIQVSIFYRNIIVFKNHFNYNVLNPYAWNVIKKYCFEKAEKDYASAMKYYEKYGFMIFGSYLEDEQCFDYGWSLPTDEMAEISRLIYVHEKELSNK